MTKEVLHAATLRHGDALDRVFSEANAKISAASEQTRAEGGANMMFVTVFAGILDLDTGDAGLRERRPRFAPFVLRDGRAAARLDTAGGPPLGTRRRFSVSGRAAAARAGRHRCCSTPTESPRRRTRATALYTERAARAAAATAPSRTRAAVVDFGARRCPPLRRRRRAGRRYHAAGGALARSGTTSRLISARLSRRGDCAARTPDRRSSPRGPAGRGRRPKSIWG